VKAAKNRTSWGGRGREVILVGGHVKPDQKKSNTRQPFIDDDDWGKIETNRGLFLSSKKCEKTEEQSERGGGVFVRQKNGLLERGPTDIGKYDVHQGDQSSRHDYENWVPERKFSFLGGEQIVTRGCAGNLM